MMRLLSGQDGALRVQGDTAYLYASQVTNGEPAGRLYPWASKRDGELVTGFDPIPAGDGLWGCVVRLGRGAVLEPATPAAAEDAGRAQRSFAAFAAHIAEGSPDAAQIATQREAGQEATAKAFGRLRDVNMSIDTVEDFHIQNEDALLAACQALGRYMGTEIRVPPTSMQAGQLQVTKVLRYSGIRYKSVALCEDWWKKDSGAMLGTLADGTPVALLPRGMRGYRMHNPAAGTTVRVNAANAGTIQATALAVYRSFPAKPMSLRQVLRFVLGEHIYLEIGIILLFSFLAALIQVMPPILSEHIFDFIVPGYKRGLLVEVILILLAFEVASIGFHILVNLGFARVKNKVELSFQAGIWDRLISLRIPFFHQFTSGELLQKIKGIIKIKDTLSLDLLKTFLSALFSFINIIVMFQYSPVVTPYVLLMFLLCFAVTVYLGRRMYRLNQKYIALSGRVTTMQQQFVLGIERIKSSRAEARAWSEWGVHEADLRCLKGRMERLDIVLDSFLTMFRFVSIAFVYFLISRQPAFGMGAFVAYISTFLILQKAMMSLMKIVHVVPELVPVMQNIKPILDAVPEQTVGRKFPAELDGSLSVDHVSFQYGPLGPQVLRDVSLHARPGESIGIIGASGSGKSTLLGLLLGLYTPTGGKIYIGGYDLDTVDMEALRGQIGVVLQWGAMSVGTIYSSLSGGDREVGEDDIYEALEMVGLLDTVQALPHGIHTALEHYEHLLSEGQMQLLTIARAIAGRPHYILFDEATSKLDNITQASVMAALSQLPATKIIIAQRTASVRYCDQVVRLEDGILEVSKDLTGG